jgi:hypothetical protein
MRDGFERARLRERDDAVQLGTRRLRRRELRLRGPGAAPAAVHAQRARRPLMAGPARAAQGAATPGLVQVSLLRAGDRAERGPARDDLRAAACSAWRPRRLPPARRGSAWRRASAAPGATASRRRSATPSAARERLGAAYGCISRQKARACGRRRRGHPPVRGARPARTAWSRSRRRRARSPG